MQLRANRSCYNCNSLRLELLYEKMQKLKADYFATGHFAKVYKNLNSEEYFIHANNDLKADQSFLLAGLDQSLLKHFLLPLSELKNEEVAKIAKNFQLNVDASSERENFCFNTDDNTSDFLEAAIPSSLVKSGPIINMKTGDFYGEHDGVLDYYLGSKDYIKSENNQINKNHEVVHYNWSKSQLEIGSPQELTFNSVQVGELKLTDGIDRTKPISCFVKTRLMNELIAGNLYLKNNDTAYLKMEANIYPLPEEENLVFYDKNTKNAKVIGRANVYIRGNFELIDRVKEYRGNLMDDENYAAEKQRRDRLLRESF